MKILSFLATIAVALLATAGAATGRESDVGSTGSLSLSLVDGSGALVAGSCFELYTASGGSYGELVNTFCNTTGSSAWTLPRAPTCSGRSSPPHLRLVRDAPAESHVYRKAPDTTFGISALHPTSVTIEHELGAAIEVHATQPDGQAAVASCFAARGFGASDDPDAAGSVVDEACTGGGATARLYVGSGEHVVSQVTGSAGFAFAPDARVNAVLDATVQVAMTMRTAAVLRIEQRAQEDGRLVEGGCYSIYASPTGSAESFVEYRCDSHDDLGRDGIVVAGDLQPGRYRLHEEDAPAGFKTSPDDVFVVLERSDVTIVRTHRAAPLCAGRRPTRARVPP